MGWEGEIFGLVPVGFVREDECITSVLRGFGTPVIVPRSSLSNWQVMTAGRIGNQDDPPVPNIPNWH